MSSEPRLSEANADLDGVDAVLAMMIIAERETRPFTLVELITVDAIKACAAQPGPMGVVAARELMARFMRAREGRS